LKKNIIIINGSGGCGKDTFVKLIQKHSDTIVMNYSSVNKVKMIAKMAGWNGSKLERDRKFLSDLKLLTSEYNDMPYNDVAEVINLFKQNDCEYLFLHIREPLEIQKIAKNFNAITLLIKNKNIKTIDSNMADAYVDNYFYDFEINNDDNIEVFEQKAVEFMDSIKMFNAVEETWDYYIKDCENKNIE